MNPNPLSALASVIVPCFNQVEFTQLCLQALFRHTRPPWELIVVDNGSTDGTGRLPGRRAGCRRRAGHGHHQCPEPRIPRGDQPGLAAARGRIPRPAQQRRGRHRRLARSAHRLDPGPPVDHTAEASREPPSQVAETERRGRRTLASWSAEPQHELPGPRDRDRPGRADVELRRRRRSWSRMCRIATWTRCTRSPAAGATSIGASGSRCPSCRASAC